LLIKVVPGHQNVYAMIAPVYSHFPNCIFNGQSLPFDLLIGFRLLFIVVACFGFVQGFNC